MECTQAALATNVNKSVSFIGPKHGRANADARRCNRRMLSALSGLQVNIANSTTFDSRFMT